MSRTPSLFATPFLVLVACTSARPLATISHPRLITPEQIIVYGSQVPSELTTGVALQRIYGTRVSDFDSVKTTLDAMLGSSQRVTRIGQGARGSTGLKVKVSRNVGGSEADDDAESGDATTPESPSGPDRSAQSTQGNTEITAEPPVGIADSPFDGVDRTVSLIGAITAKYLRSGFDPRSLDTKALIDARRAQLQGSAAKEAELLELRAQTRKRLLASQKELKRREAALREATVALEREPDGEAARKAVADARAKLEAARASHRSLIEEEAPWVEELGEIERLREVLGFAGALRGSFREYMLLHQVSVDPGTATNRMVGLRVSVEACCGSEAASEADCGPVQIIRVHPDRAYDLNPVGFRNQLEQTLSLALAAEGTAGGADVAADFAREAALRIDARDRFMSRISKYGGVIDASRGEYGWNFYPSNVQVVERNALKRFFGWLFGTPSKYETTAQLEPGARDTMVWIAVEGAATSLKLCARSLSGDIDGGALREEAEHCFTARLDPAPQGS